MNNRYITKEDKQLLLNYLTKHRGQSDAYAIIHLMLCTGARTDEILRLRPCDLVHKDLGTFIINIHHGAKGSDKRFWEIDSFRHNNLCEYLLARAQAHKVKGTMPLYRIFADGTLPSTARLMRYHFAFVNKKLFNNSKKYSLHSIRHSFAEFIYSATKGDVLSVQFALGHRSIASTQHYLKFFNQEAVRKLVKEKG